MFTSTCRQGLLYCAHVCVTTQVSHFQGTRSISQLPGIQSIVPVMGLNSPAVRHNCPEPLCRLHSTTCAEPTVKGTPYSSSCTWVGAEPDRTLCWATCLKPWLLLRAQWVQFFHLPLGFCCFMLAKLPALAGWFVPRALTLSTAGPAEPHPCPVLCKGHLGHGELGCRIISSSGDSART